MTSTHPHDRGVEDGRRERKRERDRVRYRTRYATDDAFAERERDRQRLANMSPERNARKGERNARRLWSGETYLGTADSLEQAELLNTYIELRRAEFVDRQRDERADFNSALDPELAGDDRRFDHDAAFDGLRAIARMHLRPPG